MKSLILRVLVVAIASFTFFLSPAAASNQDINQAAMLIAPTPETQIQIYAKPDNPQSQMGYGQGGDRVTVLEQVGSNDSKTWNHIRFNDSSKSPLEGWIRSDSLSFQTSDQSSPAKTQSYPSQSQGQGYASGQKSYPQHSTQQQQGSYPPQSQPDLASKLKQTLLGIKQKIADVLPQKS